MAVVITSTTSSQEAMDHAVSENWREPFVPKEAEPKAEPESKEVELSPEEAPKEEAANPEPPQPKKEHRKPSAKEQARIDELTKKFRESERREKAKDAELEALKKRIAVSNGEIPEVEPLTEPNWEEMQAKGKTHDEYVLHLRAWDEAQRRFEAGRQQKFDYLKNKYKDWEAVLKKADEAQIHYSDKQVETAVKTAMSKESNEIQSEINYYLLSNLDEAKVLVNLTPYEAGRYIAKLAGRLEGKVSEVPNAEPPPAPKPKVKPPEPIAPVGNAPTGNVTSIYDPNISNKQFFAIRKSEERNRRGR